MTRGTGRVPLPCHGLDQCAWCILGIARRPPTEGDLDAVATLYSAEGVQWAAVYGVHPYTDEMSQLIDGARA